MSVDQRMSLMPKLEPAIGIAFINFLLMLIILLVFFSFFATPSGYEIRMPSPMSDNGLEENHLTIKITGENVLYFNDKVVTINDLKRALLKMATVGTVIYLHVDRRSSMGRMSDVLDLCKGLGIAKVKIVGS